MVLSGFLLLCAGEVAGQALLVQFDPAGNDQNGEGLQVDSQDIPADFQFPGLSASSLSQTMPQGFTNTPVWPVPASTTNTLSFTVLPDNPSPYTLTSVVYDGQSFNASTITVELRSSLDGFAAPLDSFTTAAGGYRAWRAVLEFPPAFQELSTGVTVRLVISSSVDDFADVRGTLAGGQGVRLFGSFGNAPNFTGVVTRGADGSPVEGVVMNLFSTATGTASQGTTTTDGAGRYGFTLAAGDYTVRTDNAASFDLLGEIYDNIICTPTCEPGTGDTATVSAGTITGGIDFQLDPAGAISGQLVRSDNGQPLAGAIVNVYQDTDAGDQLFIRFRGGAATDSNGFYVVRGLPTGAYVAYTETTPDPAFADLVPEIFDDVACPCALNEGAPIGVTAGATTTGIDFALSTSTGAISGRVTDSVSGLPIANVEIQVQDLDLVLGSEPALVVAGRDRTDADGLYTVASVPPGNYVVSTSGDELGYARELYDNVAVGAGAENATPVVVDSDPIGGIDFALDPGGSIAGRITRAQDGSPVAGILVIANDTATGLETAGMETDGNGNYTLPALPAGEYRVSTFSGFLFNLINQSTVVALTTGENRTGVNLALTPGATIRGQVRAEATGAGLLGLLASVVRDDFLEGGQGFTDSAGNYTIQGLPPGTYYAQVSRAGQYSLINEIHPDLICVGFCDVARGQPVTVASGDVAVIDYDLAAIPRGVDALPDELDDLGAAVAIDGQTVVVGMPGDDTMGIDAGAILIYRVIGGALELVDKVFAAVPEAGARFGAAVDVDDGLIAVGAPADGAVIKGGSGADKSVFILRLSAGGALPLQTLIAENIANAADSGFATQVSIDGGLVAVGAPSGQKETMDAAGMPSGSSSGAIVLYEFDGDQFVHAAVLNDENGNAGDGLGTSLDISNGRVAGGAPRAQGAGAASVFGPSPLGWSQLGKFGSAGGGAGDDFGQDISLDGDRVLVGAPGNDSAATDAGAAFVFEFDGASFNQAGVLLPIDGEGVTRGVAGGNFGARVMMSGPEAAVGASGEAGMVAGAGAAYVYQSDSGQWQFSDRVIDDEGGSGDRLGEALGFDGETLVIGAPRAMVGGQRAGSVLGVSTAHTLFASGFE